MVPAAKEAGDRHLLACVVVFAEALIWTDRTLRDAPIPVEIGSLRLDETLDNGADSLRAELLGEVKNELREAVEFGVWTPLNRGHVCLRG
jgi:hypothetical protein